MTYYISTTTSRPVESIDVWTTYSVLLADVVARYKRLRGHDVVFLTGADKAGDLLKRKARELGEDVNVLLHGMHKDTQCIMKQLGVSYDLFYSASSSRNSDTVMKTFEQLSDNGDIYSSPVTGRYCQHDGCIWTNQEVTSEICPSCGSKLHLAEGRAYFLRTSQYADELLRYYLNHDQLIQPSVFRSSVLAQVAKYANMDVCISHHFEWNDTDFNPLFVLHEWVSELLAYLTEVGYGTDHEIFSSSWPAKIQFIGEDTIRFHAIYWPIILMALDLELPETIHIQKLFHFYSNESRLSEPIVSGLLDYYGSDAFRFLLLRLISNQSTNCSFELMEETYNRDLVGDLSTLVYRASNLMGYLDRKALSPYSTGTQTSTNLILADLAMKTAKRVEQQFDDLQIQESINTIWSLIGETIQFTENELQPLTLHHQTGDELPDLVYSLTEVVRIVTILLQPIMPNLSNIIFNHFRWSNDAITWASAMQFGIAQPEGPLNPLFPRLKISFS